MDVAARWTLWCAERQVDPAGASEGEVVDAVLDHAGTLERPEIVALLEYAGRLSGYWPGVARS